MSFNKGDDLRQRSRIKWAMEGDENSKFFHGVINNRKASNAIHGLNINGNWVTKPAKVKKEVMAFFKEKFIETCKNRPFIGCSGIKSLSVSDREFLVERFSSKEIKEAVFECGDDRAPGPDGFTMKFIKKFWDVFEQDFKNLLEFFHKEGRINVGSSSSFITLIPKSKDPVELNNYRPINLVGVISKVISKVLANRLKMVISTVISDSQSAFLKDKFILDGPLIVNELISWCKRCKRKAFLLKIDFEKAYDNVNWSFVVEIMKQMGFPELWCSWIWGILNSARSSVLVNGSPTFEFKCEKGMRQGDPISPFIFLVVMEALSVLLDKAKEEDDAIILGDWSTENVLNVVRILRVFYMCSGLRINLSKSNLFGLGVEGGEVEDKARRVGCRADNLPFRYLGIMVGANMTLVNNWKPVYDVFEARLSRWKAVSLSIGGRLVLIKSVLESLPSYYFSLYKAPSKVIKDLESMIRRFLWGSSSEGHKIHWVAWDSVSTPKDNGGLGLCKLKDVNLALLSKWCWRCKTNDNSLWRNIISAIHNGSRTWDFLPTKKNWGGTWSKIVKCIARTKVGDSPLRSFFKGVPGRGDSISFWLDPWVACEPLKDLFPCLFQIESQKKCRISNRIFRGSGQEKFAWGWKRSPGPGTELEELSGLSSLLESFSISDRKDKWVWLGDGAEEFSVKAVKQTFMKGRVLSDGPRFEWCKWVPAKCNIFAWRANLNRIPSVEALRKRNIFIQDEACGFCHDGEDKVNHIFTGCYAANVVWNMISSNWFLTFLCFLFKT
ncbi:putative RNA-directed DNA polymerase [Helianthus annuus]|nr:putative RNA-directed DNA polymerase [Helianthus annuus]